MEKHINKINLHAFIDKAFEKHLDTDIILKAIENEPHIFEYLLTKYPKKTIDMLETHFNEMYSVIQNMSLEETKMLKEAYNEHPLYKGRMPKEINDIISNIEKRNKNNFSGNVGKDKNNIPNI